MPKTNYMSDHPPIKGSTLPTITMPKNTKQNERKEIDEQDIEILKFIYIRMFLKHKEPRNIDYMIAFENIINKLNYLKRNMLDRL